MPSSARARLVHVGAAVAIAAAVVALVLAVVVPVTQPKHQSADVPTGFLPGFIISDYNFFNADAMTEQEIQSFLLDRPCHPEEGVACLSWFRQDTVSQPAQGAGHCAAYRGADDERASRIIWKVAQACGISPRVLLVLVQKEQSLLTRPSPSGYLRATGYGCPDTADCDAEYFGFFNQLYNAAWQFRQYTKKPERAYQVGVTDIRFNPDAACGSSPVKIRNQATANLYNYTPYQPNSAAVADPDAGDECSTFGNLNFWALYRNWFGNPHTEGYPRGILPRCLNLVGGRPCRGAELVPSQ